MKPFVILDTYFNINHNITEEIIEKNKNRQIYWDDIAMFCYPGDYQLGIREMKKEDVIEIDNLSELARIDVSYQK